jgi:hypothetical protein
VELSSEHRGSLVLHDETIERWLKRRNEFLTKNSAKTWVEKAWRGRPSWISRARVEVDKLWLEYADITVTTEDTESIRVEDNARYMDDDLLSDFSDVENDASTDEYQKWCEEGRQPNEYRPLEF